MKQKTVRAGVKRALCAVTAALCLVGTAAPVWAAVPTLFPSRLLTRFPSSEAAGCRAPFTYVKKAPPLTDPLTGEPTETDYLTLRPAAVVINNIETACPQEGIGKAGMIYECMVEGGITRLLALFTDYAAMEQTGSVRSARKCFLDLLANHDALFVHAGGSAEAYSVMASRKTDRLDGVNMYLPGSFYRDETRWSTMGMEHSLMINGEGIVAGIATCGYRTERSDYQNPYRFAPEGESVVPADGEARHVRMSYRPTQNPEYLYDEKTGLYRRWQFNHEKHIDGATGEQLAFTNLLILSCAHENTFDSYGHINIYMTGSGEGMYVSGGRYQTVTWSRESTAVPFTFTLSDGSPLIMNVGKTIVNIVTPAMFAGLELNAPVVEETEESETAEKNTAN